MQHLCATCLRSFEEPGFCPFDGTPLAAVATPDQQTLMSMAMPAAVASGQMPVAAHKTDVVRRETFPLTPTPPSSTPTQEVVPTVRRMDAVSATADPKAALASLKAARGGDEYDRLVGETLDGRYYVERKIGEGGMGVVFAARHAVIERPLAIKVLKREASRDTATIRRFVQEAKAASRIGHPNIVDVTDFGTTPDGMTFSVMELVHGPTLGAAIRAAAPFPMARAVKITTQIARALGAAHEKGIVHRDLKPENVFLLDRDGRTDFVKIVDFGIAKVTPIEGSPHEPRLTRAGSVFGTPEYMAPEQAAGRSDPDGRVDIYALGVILYEMLVGRVPHRGDSMVRTLAMQMLDEPVPPSRVRPDLALSPELEAIVMKALAKQREHRYPSMGALVEALEGLQTPVGLSLTGSPVYALTPLPPGADAGYVPTPPATTEVLTPAGGAMYRMPISVVEPAPRPRSPTNRQKHEPEFVTSDKPKTFEHVFTDEHATPTRRRGPLLLWLVLLLGGAAGAVFVVMSQRERAVADVSADAALVATVEPTADAAAVVPIPVDAEELALPPVDASVVIRVPRDAGALVVRPPRRDAGEEPVVDPRRVIRVQVITKPERARLYQGTSYRGEGGVTLEEPYGTRMTLECRNLGYKPGSVQVVFDGKSDLHVCELTRIKICIDNIKNPFDDCELDPTKPIPPQPPAR